MASARADLIIPIRCVIFFFVPSFAACREAEKMAEEFFWGGPTPQGVHLFAAPPLSPWEASKTAAASVLLGPSAIPALGRERERGQAAGSGVRAWRAGPMPAVHQSPGGGASGEQLVWRTGFVLADESVAELRQRPGRTGSIGQLGGGLPRRAETRRHGCLEAGSQQPGHAEPAMATGRRPPGPSDHLQCLSVWVCVPCVCVSVFVGCARVGGRGGFRGPSPASPRQRRLGGIRQHHHLRARRWLDASRLGQAGRGRAGRGGR